MVVDAPGMDVQVARAKKRAEKERSEKMSNDAVFNDSVLSPQDYPLEDAQVGRMTPSLCSCDNPHPHCGFCGALQITRRATHERRRQLVAKTDRQCQLATMSLLIRTE